MNGDPIIWSSVCSVLCLESVCRIGYRWERLTSLEFWSIPFLFARYQFDFELWHSLSVIEIVHVSARLIWVVWEKKRPLTRSGSLGARSRCKYWVKTSILDTVFADGSTAVVHPCHGRRHHDVHHFYITFIHSIEYHVILTQCFIGIIRKHLATLIQISKRCWGQRRKTRQGRWSVTRTTWVTWPSSGCRYQT